MKERQTTASHRYPNVDVKKKNELDVNGDILRHQVSYNHKSIMNSDRRYNSSPFNKSICCEIANCNNKATEIINGQLTSVANDTGNVYLCTRCKESW